MPLNVGSRLGHYDVTALIGEGGMGQVCQTTDTQLHRDVALKILPEAFTSDPDRLLRFESEANGGGQTPERATIALSVALLLGFPAAMQTRQADVWTMKLDGSELRTVITHSVLGD